VANRPLHPLIHELLARVAPEGSNIRDGDLLERFLTQNDQAGFEMIVWRHGPMVLAACRRILHDAHAAEDAFQATFLVLFRKARSIGRRQSLGSWLYKVAFRVALRAKERLASRPASEELHDAPAPAQGDELIWRDLRPVLDEALNRLPEKYRAPLVLHYLEGKSVEQIARELGWRSGTVSGRLDRARHLLRKRLVRQGVTLSTAALVSGLASSSVSAETSARLVATTLHIVHSCAADSGAVGGPVTSLAEGVIRSMTFMKIRMAGALLAILATIGLGARMLMSAAEPVRPGALTDALPAKQADPVVGKAARAARPEASSRGHPCPVTYLALSPMGNVLASVGQNTLLLWDLTTHQRMRELDGKNARAAAFSPDGKVLASAGGDDILLWDVATGKEIRRFKNAGHTLAFSPNGEILAASVFTPTDKTSWQIVLFDVGSGKEIRRVTAPSCYYAVYSLAFSPDGKTLAAGAMCAGGSHPNVPLCLFDVATGKPIAKLDGQKYPGGRVFSVAFSPDGKRLASGGSDACVRLWDVSSARPVRDFEGHNDFVGSITFSADGKVLSTAGGRDHTVRLWEVASGREIQRFETPGASIEALACSLDGKILAWGDSAIHLQCEPLRSRQPRSLQAKEVPELWNALVSDDTPRAYRAIDQLADAPEQALPILEKELRPATRPEPPHIARLIAALDSDEFAVRRAATVELEKIGPPAIPLLEEALAGKLSSLEMRRRLQRLLDQAKGLSPERLRELRAIQALEWMGTAEAEELLKKLAGGWDRSTLTQEAQDAVARLEKSHARKSDSKK
jgi:RNA polymerase sigma factor (sigma-70 family)